MSAIRRRVIVRGHVQGVFFREGVRRQAESLGVAGRIANREDGTVEAVFEGQGEPVERLLAFCREGPRDARVEQVEVFEEEPEDLQRFEVS